MNISIDIYTQHCAEASVLWVIRDAAASDVRYDVRELAELDERVEAHLDALRLGGDAAWEVCKGALESAEAGEAFVAAALSIHRVDLHGVAHVLDVASGPVDSARAIASALGWVPLGEARRMLAGLLYRTCPPELHYVGIAGAAAQRTDPGETLGYALYSDHLRLRARALRAVAECKRADLVNDVIGQIDAKDESCRFAAAWAASILGDAGARAALWEVTRRGGPYAARACDLWMRCNDIGEANRRIVELRNMDQADLAIAGARALGDPVHVPWLIDQMGNVDLARAAGDAFHAITGRDLVAGKLKGARIEKSLTGTLDVDDARVEDPEAGFAWPDATRVRSWWLMHGGRFAKGTRHILGMPMERVAHERVFRHGNQPLRAAAALELSLLEPGRPLAEVRAPGFRQLAERGGGAA